MAGELVHFEIGASDVDRAKAFYGSLLGWSFDTYGGPMEYTVVKAGDGPGGGIYKSDTPGGNPLTHFAVADIDASLAQVGELGGTPGEKKPVPTMGWYAVCSDADGNSFSLWQVDESAQ
jgi:predicted enzyme related to lactoylglutathione lyase